MFAIVRHQNDTIETELQFYDACVNGDYNTVLHLLSKNIQIDTSSEVYKTAGYTPLMVAAMAGHVPICRLLLDKGVNVNSRSDFGGTALHGAVSNDEVGVVNLLLEWGADIHVEDNFGRATLAISREKGVNEEEVKTVSTRILEDVIRKQTSELKIKSLMNNFFFVISFIFY